MKRVVVTGLGIVSPLGVGEKANWQNGVLKSKSGIGKITHFDTEGFACQVAGQVPIGEGEGEFNPDKYLDKTEQRRVDNFIIMGMGAGIDAAEDAGLNDFSEEDKLQTGTIIGSGIGGLTTVQTGSLVLEEKGPRRVSPFFIPAALINLISGHLSIKYGLKGPNHSVVTACATGTHAVGDAFEMIKRGDAIAMVAGGAEAAINSLGVSGFMAARALSTKYNDEPQKASRPWDKDRDGFVMGEGAGCLVLEELEHAKARGAKIYGEVIGYGMSGDAYHITTPAPEGNGGRRAMEMALRKANLQPEDIDYINAHGTSTPAGDMMEFQGVKTLFANNKNLSMSSTKSSIGHLLGAAGAVEAIFSLLALRDGILPPTLNLDNPEEGTEGIDLVPHTAKKKDIKTALSNSFGFGGTNATLIFKKYEG